MIYLEKMHDSQHLEEILKRKKELKELYMSLILRSFAISMISIFVPIYLLIKGFALSEVLIFYIILDITAVILAPLVAILSSKIGVKHTFLLNIPIIITYFISLNFLSEYNIPLYLISMLGGTAVVLHWIPINSDFAKSGDKKHRGEQSAYYHMIPKLTSIIAPILGAFTAELLGFPILFGLISVIIILSAIPPLTSSDYKSKIKYDWKKFLKKKSKISKLMFFDGFLARLTKVIFPIFVYLVLGDVIILGTIGSIFAIGTFVFTLMIGRLSDQIGKRKLIRLSGFVFILAWLITFSANDIFTFSVVAIVLGIADSLIATPIFALESNEAKKHPTELMTLREMVIRIGMASVMVLLLLSNGNMQMIFVFGLMASGYIVIHKFIK